MTRVFINGFGRIGRTLLRQVLRGDSGLEIVGINDLTDDETLAHLLQYDSVHRTFGRDVSAVEGGLKVGDQVIATSAEKDPSKLKWGELGAEIVLECTGVFRNKEKASAHLTAGAKAVVISAPAKGGSGEVKMEVRVDTSFF